MAKNGKTYVVCQRYYGLGCASCNLHLVCDRQGYVPMGFDAPALQDEPGVKVKPIRPDEPTPPDSEAPAED